MYILHVNYTYMHAAVIVHIDESEMAPIWY